MSDTDPSQGSVEGHHARPAASKSIAAGASAGDAGSVSVEKSHAAEAGANKPRTGRGHRKD